jgi:hypothetical protein
VNVVLIHDFIMLMKIKQLITDAIGDIKMAFALIFLNINPPFSNFIHMVLLIINNHYLSEAFFIHWDMLMNLVVSCSEDRIVCLN